MAELVPYIWALPWSTGQPAKPCRQVRDISVWLQCFACYTAVLSTRFPENTPNLLAYMVMILGATQEFEGSSWVTYDSSFRQQMAVSGNRDWSQSNGSLFTKCFTARSRTTMRCELCLNTSHQTRDCPGNTLDERDLAERLRAIEAAVTTPIIPPRSSSRPKSEEICQNFNQKRCFYRQCKYRHVCSHCHYKHPRVECPLLQGGPPQQLGQPARRIPRLGYQLDNFPY